MKYLKDMNEYDLRMLHAAWCMMPNHPIISYDRWVNSLDFILLASRKENKE